MAIETPSAKRMEAALAAPGEAATPVYAARSLTDAPEALRPWAEATGFSGKTGQIAYVPAQEGQEGQGGGQGGGEGGAGGGAAALGAVLLGLGDSDPLDRIGALPDALPKGDYRLAGAVFEACDAQAATFEWLLGAYRFTRYRAAGRGPARLSPPDGADVAAARRIAFGVALTRDLVNTPAGDMGPAALETAARTLAEANGATCAVIAGEALLEQNYPMIHAVGRAAHQPPRLIDLRWGPEDAPRVTLVGKGVCFDTGGLDLKPASGMRNMKKDMGGAATVLGLAAMVMDAGLPIRLRVLIPAVENSVSAAAFRPGDVLTARNGVTVEVGNTDAEGRLVLADALVEGASEAPELLIDMATLTGAARVALGPDLPPFYANDEELAAEIAAASETVRDPVWRMPLWAPYRAGLSSKIADMGNITSDGFAGSVTAALFLERFIGAGESDAGAKPPAWAHFDIFGWNPKARPGRPEGGEHQGGRALYELLRRRYGGDG